MTFNNTQKLLAGVLALVLVAGMTSPAYAGNEVGPCTVDPSDAQLQIASNDEVRIPKIIECANNIVDFDHDDDCEFNTADIAGNPQLGTPTLEFDEVIVNLGPTSEEHCTVTFQLFGEGSVLNNFNVTQTLWINIPPVEPTPVSGELLSLDSSALVVGGLSNAVWMIPAVAGIAGTGIYLLKFRTNRD